MNTYYRNSKGRVIVQNPFSNTEYWTLMRTADLSEYAVAPAAVGAEEVAAQ